MTDRMTDAEEARAGAVLVFFVVLVMLLRWLLGAADKSKD